jgi:Tfp pilus assembly protein PilV
MKISGQSLIEVLVAVGVILFALMGAIMATTYSIKTSRVSSDQSEASRYASLVIENIQKVKSDNPQTFFDDENCEPFNGSYGDDNQYTANVVCVFDQPNPDQVEVNVTVSWIEGTSPLSVKLNTIMSKESQY